MCQQDYSSKHNLSSHHVQAHGYRTEYCKNLETQKFLCLYCEKLVTKPQDHKRRCLKVPREETTFAKKSSANKTTAAKTNPDGIESTDEEVLQRFVEFLRKIDHKEETNTKSYI